MCCLSWRHLADKAEEETYLMRGMKTVDSTRLPLPHEKLPDPRIYIGGKPLYVIPAGSSIIGEKEFLLRVKTISELLFETVYRCFGPRSLYKLIINEEGTSFLTNDAYTIFGRLKVADPLGQIIVGGAIDVGKNCGNGSSTCIILATKLLTEFAKARLKGMNIQPMLKACLDAHRLLLRNKERLSRALSAPGLHVRKLVECYLEGTALSEHKSHFGKIFDDVVHYLQASKKENFYRLENVYVRTVLLSSPSFSRAVPGLALMREKTIYGFPDSLEQAKLVLYKGEFGAKPKGLTEHYEHKITIGTPEDYRNFMRWKRSHIVAQLNPFIEKGINVILVEKGIDESVLEVAANEGIVMIMRFSPQEFDHLAKVAGVVPLSAYSGIEQIHITEVRKVYHQEITGSHWWFLEGFPEPEGCEILLSCPTQLFLQEAERLMYGCLKFLRRFFEDPRIVFGGGNYELMLAELIREYSLTIPNKEQLALQMIADSLETIPELLASSSGIDHVDSIAKMKAMMNSGSFPGIDTEEKKIKDMSERAVIEPAFVKEYAILVALQIVYTVLRIDGMVASRKLSKEEAYYVERTEKTTKEERDKIYREYGI
jgi:chaperonin GroEL (HSP60 family)